MNTISVEEFYSHYNVPASFIDALCELDLITIVAVENKKHLHIDQINTIERLMRLHYDLEINFEGLDVINNLINRIDHLQNEIISLNNQLEFYKKQR